MAETLRVGDKVRLTGENWGEGDYPPAGTVVTVTEVNEAGVWAGEAGVIQYAHDPSEHIPGYEWERVSLGEQLGISPGWSEEFEQALKKFEVSAVDPDHYKFGGAEVIDLTRHLGFLEGNVVKYVARAGRKGDRLEDLKKARRYLDWAIEDAEKENA